MNSYLHWIIYQVKNHLRTIEQLKTDLQISRSNHEQEIHRLQSDIEVLSKDLQTTKADLSDSQNTVMEQRSSIACMTDEIERMGKQQDNSTREVMYNSTCTEQLRANASILSSSFKAIIFNIKYEGFFSKGFLKSLGW